MWLHLVELRLPPGTGLTTRQRRLNGRRSVKPCRIKQGHSGVLSTHQHRYLRTSQDDTLRTLCDQTLDHIAIRPARRALNAPQAQLLINHPMNQLAVIIARNDDVDAVAIGALCRFQWKLTSQQT